MAVDLLNSEEIVSSPKGKNKYFLNLYAVKNGKRVKIGMMTLDWSLKNGRGYEREFANLLIQKSKEMGTNSLNIRNLSATFVVAEDEDSSSPNENNWDCFD